MVKFQSNKTLELNKRKGNQFNKWLEEKTKAKKDRTGFRRKNQTNAYRIPTKTSDRSLHVRVTTEKNKLFYFAHTEKNPKTQPFKHMKDAIYEQDEHFATGSKLLHDYYRKFKFSERSKKGWRTRKINIKNKRRRK